MEILTNANKILRELFGAQKSQIINRARKVVETKTGGVLKTSGYLWMFNNYHGILEIIEPEVGNT